MANGFGFGQRTGQKFPTRDKNFASQCNKEGERETRKRQGEGDSLKMDISKGARAENIRVIVAQNSRLVSKELTREGEREEGVGKGQQKREGTAKRHRKTELKNRKEEKLLFLCQIVGQLSTYTSNFR